MRVDGVRAIASRFDGMLIDQFGVLHDGRALYPGALRALEGLRALGLPVAVLTNSGKRASANRQRLLDIGLPRDAFVDVVTSGEVAWQSLHGTTTRVFLVGREGEEYGFDGIATVRDPRDADLLLIVGSDAPHTSLDDYRRLLGGLSTPALCCNPDRWMLTPGGLLPGPGAIAAVYEELGGQVSWVGKPHGAIYAHALALIGHPPRALCIGDSAEHDVAGGLAAGLSTCLVMTGVSAGLDPATITPAPDYWMESLTW